MVGRSQKHGESDMNKLRQKMELFELVPSSNAESRCCIIGILRQNERNMLLLKKHAFYPKF